MGEGAGRVDGSPKQQVSRLTGEIETLREELGDLVSELDRRRHEALDLRLQLRRHPVIVGVAGLTLVLAVTGAVTLTVRSRRERARPANRVRELRRAFSRMLDEPHRVAKEPSMAQKIVTAAASAAATMLAKRVIERAVRPVATGVRPVPAPPPRPVQQPA